MVLMRPRERADKFPKNMPQRESEKRTVMCIHCSRPITIYPPDMTYTIFLGINKPDNMSSAIEMTCFCSKEHEEDFKRNPEKYLSKITKQKPMKHAHH